MGSYENIVKIEEIRKKNNEGDLLSAKRILDTMEIRKIKNIADLNLIAEVYAENERYEEAVDLYLKIYEKTKSRKALFMLIEVLIKLNNADDAQYYLIQYQKIAPKDFYNYVFRYKIDKLKGESFEHQIEILVELKKIEFTEIWSYELAKLYYKAGMEAECIRECSDIELWFGEGTYVEKAKILRSTYSGETDKVSIMEEIKRRAEVISRAEEYDTFADAEIEANVDADADIDAEAVADTDADTYQQDTETDGEYPTESIYDSEGDFYASANFMVHEETEEFEDDLKKDVQKIMTNEHPEDYYNFEYEAQAPVMEGPYVQEKTYYEEESASESDRAVFSRETGEHIAETEIEDNGIPITREAIEREKAEQEVENTIYQLLREDSLDEEDRKLKQLAQELQINMEELFGNFLHVLSVKKQLVKSLETIMNDRAKNMMMMITGTEGSGKTTLAKDMALFLFKARKLKSSKLAKITAEKLNSLDILTKKDILRDCCLVIENASELKRATIDNLLELTQQLHGDISFIFEEDKKNMNKLFREYPKLMDLLKNRIHLPQYTTEDLMGFALACLKQKEYSMDLKAEQVIQGKINQIAKQSEPHRHLEQIYDLMQSAMNAADIRMGKQLTQLASQGRLKDVEAVTVIVDDFIIRP